MTEVRFSGFGGQGIIRSGYILGKACSLYDDKYATLTQSFGPEARGSSCSAQVVISDAPVLYPYITVPDILVAMSRDGYEKYEPELQKDGILVFDEDLVKPRPPREKIRMYGVPSTRFAEELGLRLVANLAMMGFFTAVTGLVSAEAMRKAIPGSVPDRGLEVNLKAFERGYEYGVEYLKQVPPAA